MIQKRMTRSGDGSSKNSKCIPSTNSATDRNNNDSQKLHKHSHLQDENLVWGWDDKDLSNFDKTSATITNKVE